MIVEIKPIFERLRKELYYDFKALERKPKVLLILMDDAPEYVADIREDCAAVGIELQEIEVPAQWLMIDQNNLFARMAQYDAVIVKGENADVKAAIHRHMTPAQDVLKDTAEQAVLMLFNYWHVPPDEVVMSEHYLCWDSEVQIVTGNLKARKEADIVVTFGKELNEEDVLDGQIIVDASVNGCVNWRVGLKNSVFYVSREELNFLKRLAMLNNIRAS